jgi:hypothetical protein
MKTQTNTLKQFLHEFEKKKQIEEDNKKYLNDLRAMGIIVFNDGGKDE